MSYNINLTDGATLLTLADGTTDTSYTSLTLIGKNFAGYGEFLNENFVRILENFSNTTSPSNPIKGQIWWNSTANTMNVYTGSIWKSVSSSTAAGTAPTSPITGDLWWNTSTGQLEVWDGAAWTVVGPAFTSSQGQSGAIADAVLDISAASHIIVKFYVSNVCVAVISKDPVFTTIALTGFSAISPGFNLSSSVAGNLYNGDAYNTLRLGGYLAADYIRAAAAGVTTQKFTVNTDSGIDIGNPTNVTIDIESGDLVVKNKATNKNIILSVMKGAVQTSVLTVDGTTGLILLNADPSANLGAATKQYVDNIVSGPSSSALSRAGGNTITGVIYPDGNGTRDFGTTGARFATVYANTFSGVSTTAKYADLAERFAADAVYAPGTVVELGGAAEITAVADDMSSNVFGVISSRAAYLMNSEAGSDATHPAVAVQGRVPVNVTGTVKKGDRLISAGNGLARAAKYASDVTPFNVIGRALEDKVTDGEGTVEAVVRLNS